MLLLTACYKAGCLPVWSSWFALFKIKLSYGIICYDDTFNKFIISNIMQVLVIVLK